jgi:DNA-binding MarR family transcriptional regulator
MKIRSAEELGSLLFGRGLRLRVSLWVQQSTLPSFFAAVLAEDLKVPPSNVSQELDRLAVLGMIKQLPTQRGDRAKRFEKTSSPLWAIISAVSQVLDADFDSQVRLLTSEPRET